MDISLPTSIHIMCRMLLTKSTVYTVLLTPHASHKNNEVRKNSKNRYDGCCPCKIRYGAYGQCESRSEDAHEYLSGGKDTEGNAMVDME